MKLRWHFQFPFFPDLRLFFFKLHDVFLTGKSATQFQIFPDFQGSWEPRFLQWDSSSILVWWILLEISRLFNSTMHFPAYASVYTLALMQWKIRFIERPLSLQFSRKIQFQISHICHSALSFVSECWKQINMCRITYFLYFCYALFTGGLVQES